MKRLRDVGACGPSWLAVADTHLVTPHTSFCWEEGPENARPRESIEVRALVFSSS